MTSLPFLAKNLAWRGETVMSSGRSSSRLERPHTVSSLASVYVIPGRPSGRIAESLGLGRPPAAMMTAAGTVDWGVRGMGAGAALAAAGEAAVDGGPERDVSRIGSAAE